MGEDTLLLFFREDTANTEYLREKKSFLLFGVTVCLLLLFLLAAKPSGLKTVIVVVGVVEGSSLSKHTGLCSTLAS